MAHDRGIDPIEPGSFDYPIEPGWFDYEDDEGLFFGVVYGLPGAVSYSYLIAPWPVERSWLDERANWRLS